VTAARTRPATGPRVGMFGLFGQGNLGNDGSMEAVLGYLGAEHPGVVPDILCTRPDEVTARYNLPAAQLHWYTPDSARESRPRRALGTAAGIVADAVRTAAWVRRHDLVIVPGMGVLEATLPLRPWRTPYAMFLLSASGRVFGTRVALVSVGANVITRQATRRLVTAAARLASYRSYRDEGARQAMRRMGLDTAGDEVYPDLAFALPVPGEATVAGTVGVGVMEYSGGNDDRARAGQIRASYIEHMTRFVTWLADEGRPVRLLAGDTIDAGAVGEVLAGVRERRPGLDPAAVVAEPALTLQELMTQLATVQTVVATRYHTVLCALRLAKPTLAVGYAPKFAPLMAEMGLGEFTQPAQSLDADLLIKQFTELEGQAARLAPTVAERNAANEALLRRQFALLSDRFLRIAQSA
jgi:polysaccharide pyruvyl transferase WcaK-like protein